MKDASSGGIGERDPRVERTRCPYCHDDVEAPAGVVCHGCQARHHTDCWLEHGACATCQGSRKASGPPAEAMDTSSVEATTVMEPELAPGERLLWAGRPRQGVALHPADVYVIPFTVVWCAFAIFWTVGAATMGGGPNAFALFGVPFVLVGLYMVFGRLVHDAHRRRGTFYGVTDKRVVIVSGHGTRETKTIGLETLHEMTISEKPDGSGTIELGRPGYLASFNPMGRAAWPWANKNRPPALEMIPNAREVYTLIRSARSP